MPRPLLLEDKHAAAGATFGERWGWRLPLHYGDTSAESRALGTGAAVLDLSFQSRILVYGEDAASFLGELLTTPADELEEGRCEQSMLLDDDGRIVDLLLVCRLGPERLMLTGSPEQAATLVAELQAAVPAGHDVRIDDRQARTALLSVEGPLAPAVVANAVSHLLAPRLADGMNIEFEFAGHKALAWRCANLTPSGITFLLAPAPAMHAWEQLLAAGARPAGLGAWEARQPPTPTGKTPSEAGLTDVLVTQGRTFRGMSSL
jgi:aminomethyltransferase